ncbi:eukaryotic mitochondrial regulator protein-domain-containing protein [Blyttiomyces helicus]|uniref:Eukaryotic mitochondrial regulator protein-domain-containing protein n=1 Tax=Blyttiomyces helicus TaxID=388810 RepID=A0A4P9WFQ7_9FUNG|nr:eukaryotic mitochondrial regulator protein-domain-containing protein [Blyttiomyces helicus]|eukprot:RKO90603.1 eukaryotic mitochondrial regulator protein-domain-containing protein [Blyttiomyces helicus]
MFRIPPVVRQRAPSATLRRPRASAAAPVPVRSFHAAPISRADEEAEKPKNRHEEHADKADEWCEKAGKAYEYGRANVAQPFPMNPFFRPLPPLTDKTRTAIYDLWKKDPTLWTTRRLGEEFGLSIVRIQAILRLKALADQFVKENKPLQKNLTAGMEGLLNAQTLVRRTIENKSRVSADGEERMNPEFVRRENMRFSMPGNIRPLFQLVEEDEVFTPEDAAKLLKMEPFANTIIALDKAVGPMTGLAAPDNTIPSESIIKQDRHAKSRFTFMIADTGASKPTVLIRDTEGKLRHPSDLEKFKRKTARPTNFYM